MNDVPESVFGSGPPEDLGELAALINDEHHACEAAIKSGLEHAHQAGFLLVWAKSFVPHGEWTSWIGDHFEGSMRIAQMYMRIYRRWEELEEAKRVAFSLRGALRELSEPRRPEEPPLEGVRRALARRIPEPEGLPPKKAQVKVQRPEEPEQPEVPARETPPASDDLPSLAPTADEKLAGQLPRLFESLRAAAPEPTARAFWERRGTANTAQHLDDANAAARWLRAYVEALDVVVGDRSS